jgi:murein DD-endopeptidase MepM/ murein hydrolase activator NlpD
MTVKNQQVINTKQIRTLINVSLFIFGCIAGTFGFEAGRSTLAFFNKVSDEASTIPSFIISENYLLESIMEELPEIDAPFFDENTRTEMYLENKSKKDPSPQGGMGGALELGRSLIARRTKQQKSSSFIMNKIKARSTFSSQDETKDFLFIDGMQRRISSLPIGAPVIGQISSHFGRRPSPFNSGSGDMHMGIDIAVEAGTPILASADGEIVYAERRGGYGKAILIRHPSGFETLYAHLSDLLVKAGQKVCRGQQIGFVGTTGRSTGPHLHYEIRENDNPIDPASFIELAHILRFAK